MSALRSSGTFAVVAVIVGGLAAFKLIGVAGGVTALMALEQPAFASSDSHDEPDEHADPHGILDDPEAASALPPGLAEDGDVATEVAATCEAPQVTLADRSGLSLSELRVLRSLSQRRRDLDARESDILEREGLLQAAEVRVEERVADLRAIEARIGDLLGTLDEAEEAQINGLVALYSQMKSDEAAAIFGALDQDILIIVAARMSDQKLAPILADMPVGDAAALTVQLARRHQAPETMDALAARAENRG